MDYSWRTTCRNENFLKCGQMSKSIQKIVQRDFYTKNIHIV